MRIFAIDPGTTQSGFVTYEDGKVNESGVVSNNDMLAMIRLTSRATHYKHMAIEMISSYGMPVGREVFDTCVWIGRFMEAWGHNRRLITRKDVKMHLCNSAKAKDGNIRQALIDKLGAPGTKAAPGPTYGVSSHAWSALAVAVTAEDVKGEWE